LVFVFRGTAAAPVVADVGTCICRDLDLHISAMAVCRRHYPKPLVICRKVEIIFSELVDGNRCAGWSVTFARTSIVETIAHRLLPE
jgi:hypothetical protein